MTDDLKREIERRDLIIYKYDKRIQFLMSKEKEQAARIAELEAALKPFADAADELEDKEHGAIWESPAAMCITASDLRNCQRLLDGSRAALGEKE